MQYDLDHFTDYRSFIGRGLHGSLVFFQEWYKKLLLVLSLGEKQFEELTDCPTCLFFDRNIIFSGVDLL